MQAHLYCNPPPLAHWLIDLWPKQIRTYDYQPAVLDTIQSVYGSQPVGVTLNIPNGALAQAASDAAFVATLMTTVKSHVGIVK